MEERRKKQQKGRRNEKSRQNFDTPYFRKRGKRKGISSLKGFEASPLVPLMWGNIN
jgi:hypothetical protein